MRIQIWLTASLIALALSGCGRSDSEQGSSVVGATQSTSEETESAGNTVLDATEQAAADVGNEISETEISRIAGYGICSSIHKATIMLANEKNDGTLDSLIQTNAHQATIYSLAVSEAFQNLSGSSRSYVTEAVGQSVDSFINENFREKLLEGAELVRLKNENCDFINDMPDQAKRLMEDYPSDYEGQYERNKLLSF